MKVNMDDLLLAGLLDNDDELILLSQVCSGSDVPSFEKGFDLDTYTEEQSKASFRFFRKYIPTYIRGGFKKFEEKCCQICNCLRKFTFSVHFVN